MVQMLYLGMKENWFRAVVVLKVVSTVTIIVKVTKITIGMDTIIIIITTIINLIRRIITKSEDRRMMKPENNRLGKSRADGRSPFESIAVPLHIFIPNFFVASETFVYSVMYT